MQRGKTTKITVYEDMPTSVSSSLYGANLDCFAFNMGFIAQHDSKLAMQVLELYQKCKMIKE